MIYFIGAGPGAVDLITVRGQRLLQRADVVVYAGSLVNPQLLAECPAECAHYNSAGMTLEAVLSVMIPATRKGKLVVRLHTGDPCIYGATQEQMDALEAAGEAYEIVPGVSSFIGAAAALKTEYTLPDVSQTVILTRMAGHTPVPEAEAIEKLATHGATMVVFLTSTMIEELSQKLMAGGYTSDTPAAIVYKATWPDELVLRTTVAGLSATAKAHDIHKMALILVGRFLDREYSRSKLYDPSFTHLFRQAEEGHVE